MSEALGVLSASHAKLESIVSQQSECISKLEGVVAQLLERLAKVEASNARSQQTKPSQIPESSKVLVPLESTLDSKSETKKLDSNSDSLSASKSDSKSNSQPESQSDSESKAKSESLSNANLGKGASSVSHSTLHLDVHCKRRSLNSIGNKSVNHTLSVSQEQTQLRVYRGGLLSLGSESGSLVHRFMVWDYERIPLDKSAFELSRDKTEITVKEAGIYRIDTSARINGASNNDYFHLEINKAKNQLSTLSAPNSSQANVHTIQSLRENSAIKVVAHGNPEPGEKWSCLLIQRLD